MLTTQSKLQNCDVSKIGFFKEQSFLKLKRNQINDSPRLACKLVPPALQKGTQLLQYLPAGFLCLARGEFLIVPIYLDFVIFYSSDR